MHSDMHAFMYLRSLAEQSRCGPRRLCCSSPQIETKMTACLWIWGSKYRKIKLQMFSKQKESRFLFKLTFESFNTNQWRHWKKKGGGQTFYQPCKPDHIYYYASIMTNKCFVTGISWYLRNKRDCSFRQATFPCLSCPRRLWGQ